MQIGFKMQTRYKIQTADCKLGLKCTVRPKLSYRLTNRLRSLKAVYYTVIKHDGQLRTRRKCRKRVLRCLECNTRPSLHLFHDIEVTWRKTKRTFLTFYTLIYMGFWPIIRACAGSNIFTVIQDKFSINYMT